jgi:hypothetical protein
MITDPFDVEIIRRVRQYVLDRPDVLNDTSRWIEGMGWSANSVVRESLVLTRAQGSDPLGWEAVPDCGQATFCQPTRADSQLMHLGRPVFRPDSARTTDRTEARRRARHLGIRARSRAHEAGTWRISPRGG